MENITMDQTVTTIDQNNSIDATNLEVTNSTFLQEQNISKKTHGKDFKKVKVIRNVDPYFKTTLGKPEEIKSDKTFEWNGFQ